MSLVYNNHVYHLNQPIQTTPNGNNFRYVGISKDLTKHERWVEVDGKNVIRYCWIYTFHYTNKQSGFTLLLDCYDAVSFGGVI